MKILIAPNPSRDVDLKATIDISRLLAEAGAEVLLPEYAKGPEMPDRAAYYGCAIRACAPDVIITVGGDGTLLKAAREAAYGGFPVVGVNLGNTGFLTELDPGETVLLKRLLTGEYRVEKRMMLDIEIHRGSSLIYAESALNDCIIGRGSKMRNIPLSLYSDESEIKTFYGDGVVIATPTGTTAYSLSAGGPIVDPMAECIVITPVCPHAFYARSFVLEKNRMVKVKIGSLEQREARLSCDGVDSVTLETDDIVTIKRSEREFKIIKLKNSGFFDKLKSKLAEK